MRVEGNSDKINYTSIAIKGLLFKFKKVNATITVDGVKYEHKHVWLAPTMKGRYYGGGMLITPEQNRLDIDGILTAVIFKGRRISIKLVTPLEGESERIFKGEIIDWDDNEGLTFLRFEDGEQLQIPKSNIKSAKLYID